MSQSSLIKSLIDTEYEVTQGGSLGRPLLTRAEVARFLGVHTGDLPKERCPDGRKVLSRCSLGWQTQKVPAMCKCTRHSPGSRLCT